ncbi:MAG TPA: hypothetical protein VNZ86_02285 [Bacteroidia bacterium]|jgi:hypothetical protein|nr:hypothetical protein [Bacteroidia bacterium]
MSNTESFESLLSEARRMYAHGHDNRYIELQFADRGVDDAVIDKVIAEVTRLRKEVRRYIGVKYIFYGASLLATGIIASVLSFHSESPVRFVLWGMAVSGVLVLIKGLADLIGL